MEIKMFNLIKTKLHFLLLGLILILIICLTIYFDIPNTIWARNLIESLRKNALPVAAVFISFVALLLALYDTKIKKKYYNLSVRPFFDIDKHIDLSNHKVTVDLTNKGVGVAIIKNFRIICGDQIYDNPKLDEVENIFDGIGYGILERKVYTLHSNGVFAKDEKIELLKFKLSNMEKKTEDVLKTLSRIIIEIKYESISGELFLLKHSLGS
jgi:hypothetical protein